MKLKIDRTQLAALVATIPAPTDKVTIVKDDGIYLMSFASPLVGDKRTVVYARGYNPNTDGDVWEKCRDAVGGDDFGEDCATRAELENVLADSEGDVIVNVTTRLISISYLPKRTAAQVAARVAKLTEWIASTKGHPLYAQSPKAQAMFRKAERELAELKADAAVTAKIDELIDRAVVAHPEHADELLAAKKRNAAEVR